MFPDRWSENRFFGKDEIRAARFREQRFGNVPPVPSSSWDDHAEVLCVRLDAAGDLLMTTPALRALRDQRTGRRLTLLTSSAGAEPAALIPEIDRVLVYDPPWMKAPTTASPAADLAMVGRLRGIRFDAAVIFTVFSQSPLPAALLCHLAEIPARLAHCRENPYRLLTEWIPECEPEAGIRHEAQRQLDLVGAVGARANDTRLSLQVPPAAAERALSLLEAAGHDPAEPWVLAHPGGSAPSRRYPAELYEQALRGIAEHTGRRIVLSGSRSEQALVEGLARELGELAVPLAGRLSYSQLCGLVAAAPLLICGNTGVAHVAAAAGTPVVVAYALTNPQHTPWGSPSRVLTNDVPCRWCYRSTCPMEHHACLAGLPPQEIVTAALDLLAEQGAPSGRQVAATRLGE